MTLQDITEQLHGINQKLEVAKKASSVKVQELIASVESISTELEIEKSRSRSLTTALKAVTFLRDTLNATHHTDALGALLDNVATTANITPSSEVEVTHEADLLCFTHVNDALGALLDNVATTTNSTPGPEVEVTHAIDFSCFTHDNDALGILLDNVATTNIIPGSEIEVTDQSDLQERQNCFNQPFYGVGELLSIFDDLKVTKNNNDTTDAHDNVPVPSKVQKFDETLSDVDMTSLSIDSNLNMTKNNNDTADAHDNVPFPSKVQKSNKTFSDIAISPSSIDSNLNMTKNNNDTTDAHDDIKIQSKVHKLWQRLSTTQRKHARALGYDENSWDMCYPVAAHQYPWSSLNKQETEAALCLFNEKDWPYNKMREKTSTNELSKKAPKKKCTNEEKENLNSKKQEKKQIVRRRRKLPKAT